MKFVAIIPARYASTRFPAKPLALLKGKPIIQHVYERVRQTIPDTFVAVDNERIKSCVESFGGKAIMTSVEHKSGTDRINEAYNKIASQIEASKNLDNIKSALHNTDKMVEKAISFIIENSVLPRIEDIKRSIN